MKSMDNNSKLFVFDKKEIFLLFVLMVLMAVTSFTLGLRLGKKISYEKAGFTPQDGQEVLNAKDSVQLMSGVEEQAEELKSDDSIVNEVDSEEETLKKLEEEFNKLENEQSAPTKKKAKAVVPTEASKPKEETAVVDDFDLKTTDDSPMKVEATPASAAAPTPSTVTGDMAQYIGKYTIQLGSHPNMIDAKSFADGFRVRGYNPIIFEVELKGRGTWYRVSLGTFDNAAEAKAYVAQEQTLFQGQEYVITTFK